MKTIINNIKTLGATICQARKQQGLTQSDLAGMANVGLRFISEIENGKETSQIGKIFHVLNVLGIQIEISATWMPES